MRYWPFECWAKLWQMCVGWERGMNIATLPSGFWCVRIGENRLSRWFES